MRRPTMPYSEKLNGNWDRRESTRLERPQTTGNLFPVLPLRLKKSAPIAMLGIAIMLQVACTQVSKSGPPTSASEKAAATEKAQTHGVLKQGGKAYVRIKEFRAESRKTARPKGEAQTFRFGDAVELETKRDGPQAHWLRS